MQKWSTHYPALTVHFCSGIGSQVATITRTEFELTGLCLQSDTFDPDSDHGNRLAVSILGLEMRDSSHNPETSKGWHKIVSQYISPTSPHNPNTCVLMVIIFPDIILRLLIHSHDNIRSQQSGQIHRWTVDSIQQYLKYVYHCTHVDHGPQKSWQWQMLLYSDSLVRLYEFFPNHVVLLNRLLEPLRSCL